MNRAGEPGQGASTGDPLKALLELIVRSLVDRPDDIAIREVAEDRSTVLELHVAQDDLGKVIGKQGRTARSIRTVLAAAGRKRRQRVLLEILE